MNIFELQVHMNSVAVWNRQQVRIVRVTIAAIFYNEK
jgi:hypothetical protein